jgi:hypothetical protein
MAALQYLKIAAFQHLTICRIADRAGNFSRFHTLATVTPGWRARVFYPMPVVGADLVSLRMKVRPSERVGIGRWDRGQGDLAMDADWLWVMLALGIFIPASMVPLTFARNACRWWRDRREGRSPNPAYEQGMRCAQDDA